MMVRKNVKMFAYNYYSASARELAKALSITRVRNGAEYAPEERMVIINWGSTKLPKHLTSGSNVLNKPGAVRRVSNKLSFFNELGGQGFRLPEFTTAPTEALDWVKSGEVVLGRTILNGKGGAGIIFSSDSKDFEDFLDAPLFVKYKRKKEEYRVHFFQGDVIDVQQKMLRKTDDQGTPIDPTTVDFRIRNLRNGFIFARNNINPRPDVITQAAGAFNASELDFGAVDVIYNAKEDRAYVLEINTAPGLVGTTLDKYTAAFTEYFRGL